MSGQSQASVILSTVVVAPGNCRWFYASCHLKPSGSCDPRQRIILPSSLFPYNYFKLSPLQTDLSVPLVDMSGNMPDFSDNRFSDFFQQYCFSSYFLFYLLSICIRTQTGLICHKVNPVIFPNAASLNKYLQESPLPV